MRLWHYILCRYKAYSRQHSYNKSWTTNDLPCYLNSYHLQLVTRTILAPWLKGDALYLTSKSKNDNKRGSSDHYYKPYDSHYRTESVHFLGRTWQKIHENVMFHLSWMSYYSLQLDIYSFSKVNAMMRKMSYSHGLPCSKNAKVQIDGLNPNMFTNLV